MKPINKILKEEIELIKLDGAELKKIQGIVKEFVLDLKKSLKKKGILASVFVGGSLAKKTLVKKKVQDVDIFVRFDKKYLDKDISKLLGKVIGRDGKKVHGSRDYYQVCDGDFLMEIIPVMKIRRPSDAVNITDLSYFHVDYFLKKLRDSSNLGEEIMLAKTFTHSCNSYGAESYINGFSGYALELLICHYGSFLKFIKAVVRVKDKIVIDDAKFYNGRGEVLKKLNKSKIKSPVILIDPTFKERNALAGLSDETFFKFKKCCKGFLNQPSHEFFKIHDVRDEFLRDIDLQKVQVVTNKQAGDIAGTKSKKFFRFFLRKLSKEFVVKKKGFSYDEEGNVAVFYLVVDVRKEEVVKGPPVGSSGVKGFKKAHPNNFVKGGFVCVKMKHGLLFNKWFEKFVVEKKKIIKEMSIKKVELI